MEPAGAGSAEVPGRTALRVDVLRRTLSFMAVGMPLIATVIFIQVRARGRIDKVTVFLCSYAIAFPILRLLFVRLRFYATAIALLVLICVLAFLVEVRGGPTAGSAALGFILIILSGVLLGRRGALYAVLVTLLLFGAAGWLVLGDHVPAIDTAMWDPQNAEAWIRGAFSLGLFGTAAAVAVVFVTKRLEGEAAELRSALERERTERSVRQAAEAAHERTREAYEAAKRMEMLGRLAGGVAHDFNNLLTVILGCSELLREKVGPGAAEELEDVEQIHAAGVRARDLTGQLLAFARKQPITPTALDLNAVLRKSENMLRHVLGEDVDLMVSLSPHPWTVLADMNQVEQVVLNLAVNARDAMPKGGQLFIETRNASVSEHEASADEDLRVGDWVQLLVRDTGVGMTPEVRAHLFEPFFTTKEQGKGTGLGLATVYGIVKQAAGHIHVESEPSRGTTIQVCFPRVGHVAVSASSPKEPTTTGGTERILVVEDDPKVRAVVVRTLGAEGYRVSAVGNPREALDLNPEELGQMRLLVTDVVMPEIDGHALAEELGQRCPALRVLYLSGYSEDVVTRRGVLGSGAEFLAKPFTRASLLSKVRAILDASEREAT